MRLSEEIRLLTPDNTVEQISEMLKNEGNVNVSVGACGERLFSIQGYEGVGSIDKLALKYFEAAPFTGVNVELEKSVKCDDLWTRVERLYLNSDPLVKEYEEKLIPLYNYPLDVFFMKLLPAWIICNVDYFSSLRCPVCTRQPRALFANSDFFGRGLFTFSPTQFKKLWPDAKPEARSWVAVNGKLPLERWTASRKMVESVRSLTKN